jgi:hypothetical protein
MYVVAIVTQLDLAGVHSDAQADRGHRRPVQRQRTRDRVAGPREGHDEAVSLPLLDRPYPVMGANNVGQRAVQQRDRGGHVVWSVSHKRVDPSTSASSNVTVPVGKSPITPRSLQFSGVSALGLLMLASLPPREPQNISETA